MYKKSYEQESMQAEENNQQRILVQQKHVQNKSIEDKKYLEDKNKELKTRILKNYVDQRASDWTENKFETLSNWMKIAAFYIQINDKCINKYKLLLKVNTIMSLVLSTTSGTFSVLNFNSSDYSSYLNIGFTVSTFCLALFAGYIKVDQVQEKLEEFIKLKQEWTAFSAALSAELVLPLNLRQSSVELINRYKGKFLDLIKADVDYPYKYKMRIREEGYSLSQIINTFIDQEDIRLKERVESDIPAEELNIWKETIENIEFIKEQEHRRLYIEFDDEFRIFHRENKQELKTKHPEFKPRQITDQLYERYQELMFNVKKDIKYFIQFYNYISLASEQRNRQQQSIEQEFQVVVNDTDQVFSCFVLNNWYREHTQQPEKTPLEISNQFRRKYYGLSSKTSSTSLQSFHKSKFVQPEEQPINRELWSKRTKIMNAIKPVLIEEGPAALMYYVNNYMTIYNLYENSPYDDIRRHYRDFFQKNQTKSDKEKLASQYVSSVWNFFNNIFEIKKSIKKQESQNLDSYFTFKTASKRKRLWSNIMSGDEIFDQMMNIMSSSFKMQRENLRMYENPFYQILQFQGFDIFKLYPDFSIYNYLNEQCQHEYVMDMFSVNSKESKKMIDKNSKRLMMTTPSSPTELTPKERLLADICERYKYSITTPIIPIMPVMSIPPSIDSNPIDKEEKSSTNFTLQQTNNLTSSSTVTNTITKTSSLSSINESKEINEDSNQNSLEVSVPSPFTLKVSPQSSLQQETYTTKQPEQQTQQDSLHTTVFTQDKDNIQGEKEIQQDVINTSTTSTTPSDISEPLKSDEIKLDINEEIDDMLDILNPLADTLQSVVESQDDMFIPNQVLHEDHEYNETEFEVQDDSHFDKESIRSMLNRNSRTTSFLTPYMFTLNNKLASNSNNK